MSQRAQGKDNIQITVARSKNVVITAKTGQDIIELEIPTYPRPLPANPTEIDLLKAAHAQIPFVGRDDLLQDFLRWCENPPAVSFRTLIGRGGAGKTRFAYELYARVKRLPNWSAVFLHFYETSAKGVDLWSQIPTTNVLLIADYAPDSAAPLADLLRPLTNPAPDDRRIRILLLARTATWDQGWLAGLTSGRTGENVDSLFDPRDPIDLLPLTSQQRRDIFQQMIKKAAEQTGILIPKLPPPQWFEDKDTAECLADPLTVMMAALIALESDVHSALRLSRTQLAHEVAQKLVAGRMKGAVPDHRELFLHMAAYATLVGGLSQHEALAALEEESKETKLGSVPDPQRFLEKLQAWLPGEKSRSWLGSIEPDIVGEAFILGQGATSYLWDAEHSVVRAARRRAGPATGTVIRVAQDFSFLPTDSRLEPLHWLTRLVERGEADSDLSLLLDIADAMPNSSVVLRQIGLRIYAALVVRLRLLLRASDEDSRQTVQSTLVISLTHLSLSQGENGQRQAALATAKGAVKLCRELVAENRDTFLSDLGGTLSNLAARRAEVGQYHAALTTGRELVNLCRELVDKDHDANLALLAQSLSGLATIQRGVGDNSSALANAEEAVKLCRKLAEEGREGILPNLAVSLNNLAISEGEMGNKEAARTRAQETVGLYRELADRERDTFLPLLAASLINCAMREYLLSNVEAALATAYEAVSICRELAERNHDGFLMDLAMSLNNLAFIQSAAEQRESALENAKEAAKHCRELLKGAHGAFAVLYARCCLTLCSVLYGMGRSREARFVVAKGIWSLAPEMFKYPFALWAVAAALLYAFVSGRYP